MRKKNRQNFTIAFAIATLAALAAFQAVDRSSNIAAQTDSPAAMTTPAQAEFDQAAALAKIREQIKGRETEPSEKVFKNIQLPHLKDFPAGRLLAIMEIGYARSLGVNCTHCHVPDKWEADDKPKKQVAREMALMLRRINSEILKGIKNLQSESPVINCTTCHRGETKPALNIGPR